MVFFLVVVANCSCSDADEGTTFLGFDYAAAPSSGRDFDFLAVVVMSHGLCFVGAEDMSHGWAFADALHLSCHFSVYEEKDRGF